MELRRNGVLMMSAPAVAAVLMSALLLGGIVPNTTDKFSESLGATGYVVVSVVRDGNEIYHYEDHNQITEAGVDFIIQQVSGTPDDTEFARYIALSTTTDGTLAVDDDNLSLDGELDNTNGLGRALATLNHTPTQNDNDDNYTIQALFTATNSGQTGVTRAGLFTDSTGGTMLAENVFSSVNLAAGDQLTITWTIDLGLDSTLD